MGSLPLIIRSGQGLADRTIQLSRSRACHVVVMRLHDNVSRNLDVTIVRFFVPVIRQFHGKALGIFLMKNAALAVVGHLGPQCEGDSMAPPHALAALAALGQPTRLEVFRLLMRAEPDGLSAGALAGAIGCPHNTLSSHVAILARSGLVRGTRDGRSIIYRAGVEGIRALVSFLVTDCCDGHPEFCHLEDAIRNAACGCGPTKKAKPRRKRHA
jgi:ArsR family transcriptional regulator, arsenate/arsenite/antimonite-responsive transcriptional repressor